MNTKLAAYNTVTDLFDAFVHVDAKETHFVYEWRMQQERALRQLKGTGMTDEQVVAFVDAYYPAYELYSEGLRKGLFGERRGRCLRLVVDRDRKVVDTVVL